MLDRLEIASRIVVSIFQGVPFSLDDFEPKDDEKKTCAAIARVALLMADELLIQDAFEWETTVADRVKKRMEEQECLDQAKGKSGTEPK